MDDATARTKVEAGAKTTARLETLVAGMPIPFGGDRVALDDLGVGDISQARRLQLIETRRLGDDLLLISRPAASAEKSPSATEGAH